MPNRKAMIDFEDWIHDGMAALAEANGRTLRAEVLHACRRHLEAPPRVQVVVDVPTLPPAEIGPPAKPQKKRGRPRKAK